MGTLNDKIKMVIFLCPLATVTSGHMDRKQINGIQKVQDKENDTEVETKAVHSLQSYQSSL